MAVFGLAPAGSVVSPDPGDPPRQPASSYHRTVSSLLRGPPSRVPGMTRAACMLALGSRRRFLPVGGSREHRFLLDQLGFGGDALAERALPDPRDAAERVAALSHQILNDETWEPRVERALERQSTSLERWNRRVVGALTNYRRPA